MAPTLSSLLVPLVLLVAVLVVPLLRPGRALTGGAAAAFLTAVAVVVSGQLEPRPALLLLFTTGLCTVVATFSRRHLDGDVRRARYDRLMLLTAAAAVLAVTTDDLLLLLVGWVLTGWGLTALVGHHDGLATTDRAVRTLRRARLVGDAGLTVAVGALVVGAGRTGIPDIASWAGSGSAPGALLVLASAGIALAAGARSGLVPFSRWLPLSVVAPAPVSALLHAGIANAPVVLLVALVPVWTSSPLLAWGLLAYALGSALLTFPRLLVRADVKTRLAWSTTAQLAFMLALVAAGAYVAALLHMMLHGVYKALAFLWAGAELPRARLDRLARTDTWTRVAGAVLGTGVVAAVVALDGGLAHPASSTALLLAGAAGGYGLFSLRAGATTRVLALVVAVASVAVVLLAARGLATALGAPLAADGPRAWVAAGGVLLLAALGLWLRTRRHPAAWAVLHRAADPVRVRRPLRPVDLPPTTGSRISAAGVSAAVAAAAETVPPSWGWQSFIATNPLLGEESQPFQDAVRVAAARGWSALDGVEPGRVGPAAPSPVDDVLAGWLAAWTNTSAVPVPAPGRELALWQWVRDVAALDPVLGRRGRALVHSLPRESAAALAELLPALGVREPEAWARTQLLHLPGWAGYLGRRGTVGAGLDAAPLVDLLAARAVLHLALGQPRHAGEAAWASTGADAVDTLSAAARLDDEVRSAVCALEARERQVTGPVLAALDGRTPPATPAAVAGARPDATLVFCIDVRSEVLRRHLEAAGRYRTVGFAGFFGMPVRRACAGSAPTDRLPILLAPTATVREDAPPRAGIRSLLTAALREALDAPGSGFAAVDVASLRGLLQSARVLAPALGRPTQPSVRRLHLDLDAQPQLLDAAVGLVRAAGLHGASTGRLVVLVGHGSTSTNNPAEAAFDCGACGGSRGAFNARVAAAVLATEAGRAAVAEAGLELPTDTVVVAAEHDTALDVVRILDPASVPESHRAELARLEADLALAGAATAAERATLLPGARTGERATASVRRRALDPGEVRHEWGLAGNALFIAAPRSLTQGTDLRGRAFLHDYDPGADPSGALLELILTAPVVVAHWINMQYVLSTADPEHLGSGSKTAHNPVGGIGVLSGATGDLRAGLAEQSVRHLGRPVVDPTRLCVVVHADSADVDAVLERHPDLAALVTGEWMSLHAHDPATGAVLRRTAGGWEALRDESAAADAVPEVGRARLAPVPLG